MLTNLVKGLLLIVMLLPSVTLSNATEKVLLENFHNLKIKKDSSIFFLETSRNISDGHMYLKDRVSCAVESGSIHHENRTIYLIYIINDLIKGTVTCYDVNYLNVLKTYKNIKVVHASLSRLVEGTPARDIVHEIKGSSHRTVHYSDILRLALLYKYGGIYFDSDVMILKSFNTLGKNFVAAESNTYLANGIMGFQQEDLRKMFLYKYLVECRDTYETSIVNICGPRLISGLMRQLCKKTKTNDTIGMSCSHINVFDKNKFYAIPYQSWKDFFDSKKLSSVLNNTKDSFAIHTWNTFSSVQHTLSDLNSAYVNLAKRHCPKTYQTMMKSV